MRLLVTIDLSNALLAEFETYEAQVLPLLARHGGRLEFRVRAINASSETHLLYFADEAGFKAYMDDPERVSRRSTWDRTDARASVMRVEQFPA